MTQKLDMEKHQRVSVHVVYAVNGCERVCARVCERESLCSYMRMQLKGLMHW